MTYCIASKVVGLACLHHPKKMYQEENTLLNARINPPRREEVVY
jgi:hypothetical protein